MAIGSARRSEPRSATFIKGLVVPSLLVLGDVGAGAVVSREVAGELARLNPLLKVEPIVGAGHGIPYDQPERLAEIARGFRKR